MPVIGRCNQLVTLIERRKSALGSQIGIVHRPKVAVEIGGVVGGPAPSVVAKQREVIAEAFLNFENASVVEGRSCGRVLVCLQNQGFGEAGEDNGSGAWPRIRVPVLERDLLRPCGEGRSRGGERRSTQVIDVDRRRQVKSTNVDAAGRDGEAFGYLPLDSK